MSSTDVPPFIGLRQTVLWMALGLMPLDLVSRNSVATQ